MDLNKLAIDIFDKYALQYEELYMDVGLYAESLDLFCRAVHRQGAAVLDLACGPGNIASYLLRKRPDFRLLGIDLAPKMLDLARKNVPDADFQLMDCREIDRLEGKFSGILGGFVLPYLSPEEAREMIAAAAALLEPEGILYLSAMEEDPALSGFQGPGSGGEDKLYMHYHLADDLVAALQANGLERISLHRLEYEGKNGALVRDMVLLAKA